MMTRKDNLFLTLIGIAAFVASFAQWGSIALMTTGGAALLFGEDQSASVLLLVLGLMGYLVSFFCYRSLARLASYYLTRLATRDDKRR
jgi:hypothetical protein